MNHAEGGVQVQRPTRQSDERGWPVCIAVLCFCLFLLSNWFGSDLRKCARVLTRGPVGTARAVGGRGGWRGAVALDREAGEETEA